MSWVDESETDADLGRIDLELDYFTIPVALEVGYKVAPEADLFGSLVINGCLTVTPRFV